MTNRISFPPQDFQKMCEQAERDHEARKLQRLMERLKKQIAASQNPGLRLEPKPSVASASLTGQKLPSRPAPFDR
ncbi:MAG TPA: hypothetical protein VMX38_10565 [Verrucomicrobiae bacterium]|jgi:hypothetical protein|nr:hypothetical protein [Verrucomicrobiae bacterium]